MAKTTTPVQTKLVAQAPAKPVAQAPAKPVAQAPAKPVAQAPAPAEAKEKKVRVPHPLTLSEDKSVYPLVTLPEDWDWKKFKPLKQSDFAEEKEYCLYRAAFFDRLSARWTRRAQESQFASKEDRKRIAKVNRWAEQIAALVKELPAGTNAQEILAQYGLTMATEDGQPQEDGAAQE